MSNEEIELINLYSAKILSLAATIPLSNRLKVPDTSIRKHSPICGSTVTVDLKTSNNVIIEFGQDIKACALGQAAASVLGKNIIGLTKLEIKKGRDQLSEMLTNNGPIPDKPFEGFEPLQSARSYSNRHASILLAIDATLEALDEQD